MFHSLVSYHFHNFLRFFSVKTIARVVTVFLFLIFLGIIALGIYFFTYTGFIFILKEALFKEILPLYIFELFLLMIMILTLFSSLISGIFQLFGRKNDNFILCSPSFSFLPDYLFFLILISSLWPLILVALPILLAVQKAMNLSIFSLLLGLLSIILLTTSTIFVSLIIIFLAAKILKLLTNSKKTKALTMGRLIMVTLFLFVVFSFFTGQRLVKNNLLWFFKTNDIQKIPAAIMIIQNQFNLFPSHLSAITIYNLFQDNSLKALKSMITLIGFFIITSFILEKISSWFFSLWQILQEGRFEASIEVAGESAKPSHFPRLVKSALGAIFEKEILLNFRTMKNLLWFGFLLFLWLTQTGFNLVIGRNIQAHEFYSQDVFFIFQALQIIIALYFIAAFVLRFAFPTFSAERRSLWILASAPIKFRQIFLVKFLFFSLTFILLSLLIGFINALILHLQLSFSAVFLILLITSAIFVTTLGLSFGALFPSFETDDPELLSTSLPGLFFIFLSLTYGGLEAFLYFNFLRSGGSLPIILFISLSFLTVFLLLSYASYSLEKIEFTTKQL